MSEPSPVRRHWSEATHRRASPTAPSASLLNCSHSFTSQWRITSSSPQYHHLGLTASHCLCFRTHRNGGSAQFDGQTSDLVAHWNARHRGRKDLRWHRVIASALTMPAQPPLAEAEERLRHVCLRARRGRSHRREAVRAFEPHAWQMEEPEVPL